MLPSLDGTRVFLRALSLNDANDLFEIYGCKETMQFASDPAFDSIETVYEMLASVERLEKEKESFEWAIIHSSSAKLIGTCGLHTFSEFRDSCEVGCMLNRRFWGKGLMQEALNILFVYAASIGINRIHAEIDGPNERSAALFKKLGFTKTKEGQYGLSFQNVA